jgi:hypothetical protein
MAIRDAVMADSGVSQRLGKETCRHYFGSLWQNG